MKKEKAQTKSKSIGTSEYIKSLLDTRKTSLIRDLKNQEKEIADLETKIADLKKYREDMLKYIKDIEDHLS